MKTDIYQIDAFTNRIFHGNPACIIPLQNWLPDDVLQNIAKENAVAETAFFIEQGNRFSLRWFTPDIEMDLCGHATLAAAYVIKVIKKYEENEITFTTISGDLLVTINNSIFTLNFPSRIAQPTLLPEAISSSLNIQPIETLKSRDYILIYDSEEDIKNIIVDREVLDRINLDPGGVVVTSKGSDCDFVSRYFTPQASILEDPVTGSAHCSLIPYWSEILEKNELFAKQLSERQGELYCKFDKERVYISGTAVTYSIGSIWV